MEIITISREQYKEDLKEAARQGALIALHESGNDKNEWLTYDEAKEFIKVKDDQAFRNYRQKNKIAGKGKVQLIGKRKMFNKAFLIPSL